MGTFHNLTILVLDLKKTMKITPIIILALSLHASAQRTMQMPDPLAALTPAQKKSLRTQAQQFFDAAKPAVTKASKSTVTLSYRAQRVAYGTVVQSPIKAQNVILTKWSEISKYHRRLVVTTPSRNYNQAHLIGVYPEHDLAMLQTDAKLTPIDLKASSSPRLGEFIALASPSGDVLSLGVISVESRSLRETDKAFLGVKMDFKNSNQHGTPLERVVPESPASRAGLRQGDIVTSIDRQSVQGAMEMRNTLQKLIPGSNITINYRRAEKKLSTQVRLGSRPKELDASRIPQKRMDKMQRMGAVLSQVRYDFPDVIQSDMPIQPDETPDNPLDNFTNECGGPVVDLDGKVVGLVIARGSRIKTFIIPTTTIAQILKTPPSIKSNAPNQSKLNITSRGSSPSINRKRLPSSQKIPPRAIPLDE